MFHKMFTSSQRFHKAKCKDLRNIGQINDRIYDRHLGIPGFDPDKFSKSKILMIGAGGLNGEIGEGLVRKGIGELIFVDHDEVSLSNLNRQQFFQADIEKPKAVQIVKNLQKVGFMGTMLKGYAQYAQIYLEQEKPKPDLIVCGVDNDEARIASSKYSLANDIPVIFTAVSRDGNQGYVFIQKPDEACFGCVFPNSINNEVTPCPNVPAIKDILKVVAGLVIYGIDSVLMDRKITWNYRMVFLAGFMNDHKDLKVKNPDCQLCSKRTEE